MLSSGGTPPMPPLLPCPPMPPGLAADGEEEDEAVDEAPAKTKADKRERSWLEVQGDQMSLRKKSPKV
jgi:hypothetical protein